MKKRVITAVIVWLILAGVVLPPVVADLHALLSGQRSALTIKPWVGWQVVLGGEITLRLYLLLAALCALGVLWAVVWAREAADEQWKVTKTESAS